LGGGEGQSDTRIKRILHADRESSEWNIDGCPATLSAVELFMKSMNIQLGNLLQFMPQDRVSEFASLSPVRLLEETEKSIDPDLYETHISLLKMGRTLQDSSTKTKTLESDLKRVTTLMRNLERDVERIRQVAQLTKEAAQIDAKIRLLAIDEIEENLRLCTEDVKKGEEDSSQKQGKLRQLSELLMDERKRTDDLQSDCTTQRTKIAQAKNQVTELQQTINQQEDLIEDKMSELNNLAAESMRQKEKIETLKEREKSLEEELGQIPGRSEEIKKAAEQIEKTCSDRLTQMLSVQSEIDQMDNHVDQLTRVYQQIEEQIDRLENVKICRVQFLEKKRPLFRGLVQAYEYVKQNQDKFQMPVIGPLITEVNVKDKQIAQYVETQVPLTTWTLFIVQCDDDMKTLRSLQHMRELNVIRFEGHSGRYVPPSYQALSQFGISGCLADFIEAPDIVKHVMDSECNMSHAVVATSELDSDIETLFDADQKTKRLFTPSRYYTCIKSRYAATSSVSTNQLHDVELLKQATDSSAERSQLERKLGRVQNEIDQATEEKQLKQKDFEAFQANYTEARKEQEDINQQKKELDRKRFVSSRRLKETQKEIERMQNLPDPTMMEEERKLEMEELQDGLIKTVKAIYSALEQQWALHEMFAVSTLSLQEAKKKITAVENKHVIARQRVDEQDRIVSGLKNTVRGVRLRLRMAQTDLAEKFPDLSEWTEVIESLPSDRAQLEDLASEKRYQAATLTCNNPDAMTSYEQLQSQVVALEGQLETSKSEYEQARSQVDQAKRTWLPRLKEAVARINNAFMDNFLQIDCIGQVSLQGEEVHGNDFQNYALEIKVKFRVSEPLKVLDTVRQSGGERVVATTLYLLSLQDVSHIPFRVMDEINHGMDEENERRVMGILASKVESPSMPQTFLLTPKMFSNPDFLQHATTHTIANGQLQWIVHERRTKQ